MAVEIPMVSDYHAHLRQDEMTEITAKYLTRYAARILVMPNTRPAIRNGADIIDYRQHLYKHIKPDCDLMMSIKLLRATIPEEIQQAATMGCSVVKMYPDDPDKPGSMTTNTEGGITLELLHSLVNGPKTPEQKLFHENIRTVAKTGMVLSCHGELPGEEVHKREKAFIRYAGLLLHSFGKLKVVLEHITTADAVRRVKEFHNLYPGRIAATITAHHLKNTLTDMTGGKLRPHLHCMPMLKFEKDRRALQKAAFSGEKYYFFGSDSAPWYRYQKECDGGCAGVWSAPCAIETLFEIFETHNKLSRIVGFTSKIGDRFYHKQNTDRILRMEKQEQGWVVPDQIEGLIPYRAGERVTWRIQES